MKIVILDSLAVSSGDVSWAPIEAIAPTMLYDATPTDLIPARVKDADYIFCNRTPINRAVIEGAPNLKWIGVFATGYNLIDSAAAKEKGIVVANVPGYSTHAVAQMVFALILELYSHVGDFNTDVHNGVWQEQREGIMWRYPLNELYGKTIGIVGFGAIGGEVAKLAQTFGLKVLAYSRTVKPELENEQLRFVPLDTLLQQSDIVSVHLPLFDSTRGLISAERIAQMKRGAVLVNTARGPVVDEQALAEALNSGRLSGAAVDVVAKEPIVAGNPLLTAKNCIITPHVAWAPIETRTRLIEMAAENLKSFIAGAPKNVVNP